MRRLIFLLLASCASSSPDLGSPRSFVVPSADRPLILDWPAADRAALSAESSHGLVLVRSDDGKIELLRGCAIDGSYRFSATAPKRYQESIRSEVDLSVTFPLLTLRAANATNVRVDLVVNGTFEASRRHLSSAEIPPACARATHFVAAMTAGAFAVANEASTRSLLEDGDLTCAAAGADRPECRALVRLELARLDAPDAAPECPAGTKWDGSACVARVDRICPAGTHFVIDVGCARDEVAAAAEIVTIPATKSLSIGAGYPPNASPIHMIAVGAFSIDVAEVSVASYRSCVDAGRCTAPETRPGCNWPDKLSHPVNCVDWNQAQAYCAFASRRLPTEEEWERAVRGDDGRPFPWGTTEPNAFGPEPSGERACWKRWDAVARSGDGTCPVKSIAPDVSALGVRDLAGSVEEWTASPFCPYRDPTCNTRERTIRGGSWRSRSVSELQAWTRTGGLPSDRSPFLGFRCAGTPEVTGTAGTP